MSIEATNGLSNTAAGNRVPGGDTGRTKLPNPLAPPVLSGAES